MATCYADGDVHGFLLGILDTPAHYSFLLRSCGASLALRDVTNAIVDPDLGWGLLKSRGTRYARGIARSLALSGRQDEMISDEKLGMLAHLVVKKDFRWLGIGRELVTYPGDHGAGPFYARLGWDYRSVRTSRSAETFELYVKFITA